MRGRIFLTWMLLAALTVQARQWNESYALYKAMSPSAITDPAPGSTLTSSTVTFSWDAGSGVSTRYLAIGTALNGEDLYSAYVGASSQTVTGLPTNGSTVYVRLFSWIDGNWVINYYTYTAVNMASAPAASNMTSPTPGSTLPGSTVTFSWDAGSGVSTRYLAIGTALNGQDLYSAYVGASSQTVDGLPTNGSTVYVRLFSWINGNWVINYYTYTAAGTAPVASNMTSPTPDSTLPGSTVTFSWDAGSGVSTRYLAIGTALNGQDLYSGYVGASSQTVDGLPTNGSTVYVRLLSWINGNWVINYYTYTAAGTAPVASNMTSPTPGSTLPGSTVTFSWDAGSGVSTRYLAIGTALNGQDLYSAYVGPSSQTVSGLPTNGSTIYVRLFSWINGNWQINYYTYTAYNAAANVSAVPTYESAGLYWSAPGAGSDGCTVQYRPSGTATWNQGLNLWFDSATNECRGSLVYLTPGTSYDVQLGLPGQTPTKAITFATWSNTYPVAQTISVPSSSSATLNVTQGGSSSGYVVYDGTGSTLDAHNTVPYNITINASYVIVRGFTLTGAQQHGILIDKNQHDVIIEDNDISGWGRTRDGTYGVDMDSGIRAICANEELTRVTIQRNKIHDPRWPTNSWSVGHPAGAQGITFSFCGGNNVYRWNEIDGGANHFNDGMGGEDNFSTGGWPNKDSDVYGNKVMHTWDDGLEIEGGDRNVRVWGNYLDEAGTGISSTIDSVGPLYVFRNVWNRNQFLGNATCDNDQRQPFSKSGSSSSFPNGRRYLFHNTMLQARDPSCQHGLGGAAGIGGTGSTELVENTVSMNNIYDIWIPQNDAFFQIDSGNTFTNDMTDSASPPEVNGNVATPVYAPGNGWQSMDGGMYQLAPGTPGYDQGVRIANFNDHFNGAGPDVGAAEAGDSPMLFGIAAAPP